MRKLAIVVRDDDYDKMRTPLTFAYMQARQGVQVDMLFALSAVRALTEEGAREQTTDGRHGADAQWPGDGKDADGGPAGIHDWFRLLNHTGNVRLYGCQVAATNLQVSRSSLVPEATGIVDPGWFLNERAVKADHCQHF